ncbi:DUF92 domain-containing protein [Paenibacillus sp. GCM10023248]|uniref:DUF92 domain-containing protein n=1 Tax=unclassified Paenibacillus TaxID=185978 RepID=UPI002379EBEB|nr:DUF92 domain-containing protein [Paenibacillus sp. MAHUQ-63]MDD9265720.1 DUF92 domain-containing protein [Paenibacillus sp. MAHUQ-63]
MEWIMGLGGSLIIAGAAYLRRSLSGSGLLSAIVLGTLMFVWGSLAWFGMLIAFFITSSVLSKLKHERKAAAESGYAKGDRRDAGQVAANGGLGLALCACNAIWPDPVWWMLFVGVMATVTADTWATEIGGMSKSAPKSIVNGKRVPPGTSGGVSLLGLLASLAGGACIGGIGGWLSTLSGLGYETAAWPVLAALGAISGLAGSLTDSWLGATLQVMYRCQVCGKEIEKKTHCEQRALQIRGISFMTNDGVNALSSLAGGIVCLLLWLLGQA